MSENTENTIVLGGGCFWCVEAAFQLIEGAIEVVSGYAGGSSEDAEYYAVSSGKTGHAEVVSVTYDPTLLPLHDVLDIFWAIHDPTTPNKQGHDEGPQYRSVIFYNTEAQKQVIDESIASVRKLWNDPVVTEVQHLDTFYPAEAYHHNYFETHPEQAYCQIVINPKLEKLRSKFAAKLK